MEGEEKNWVVLQIADSSFPTGGFAHSGGLEAAWQLGWVGNAEALEGWLRAQVVQTSAAMGPFVREAWRHPERLVELEGACEAFLSNHVMRRASAAQGQAFVLACSKAFGGEAVAGILKKVRGKKIEAHFAPVFGAMLAALGIDREEAIRVFMFISVRGWISAAVRLGIVGPLEGQRMQWSVGCDITPSLPARGQSPDPLASPGVPAEGEMREAVQTAPVLDLIQGVQDRLYTRLFQS